MLSLLRSIMDGIDDPSVVFVGLFRIDGTPILVKCKKRSDILNIIYWLEKHVKASLSQILAENLNDLSAKFREYSIRIVPLSKTLAIVVVAEDELSLYKFEMNIESLKEKIRELS